MQSGRTMLRGAWRHQPCMCLGQGPGRKGLALQTRALQTSRIPHLPGPDSALLSSPLLCLLSSLLSSQPARLLVPTMPQPSQPSESESESQWSTTRGFEVWHAADGQKKANCSGSSSKGSRVFWVKHLLPSHSSTYLPSTDPSKVTEVLHPSTCR